jgi:hypothetical protein
LPIYIKNQANNKLLAKIASDQWDLKSQIVALENWLLEHSTSFHPAEYVADIGFSVRPDACGGGAILSVQTMAIMSDLGMKLYLSEYSD